MVGTKDRFNPALPAPPRKGTRPLLYVVMPRWPGQGSHRTFGHRYPPMALYVLAALARREGWDVFVVDQNYQDLPAADPDLVAITVWTMSAPQAYRTADAYRARGVPVVLGGVHASLLPGEALRHADAVVAGEAEAIFGTVLADAAAGALQPIYHGSWGSMDAVPGVVEFRDIIESMPLGRYYPSLTLQTTRGCRFNCDFCSVIRINGRGSRHLEPDQVVEELRQRRAIPPWAPFTFVFFLDDDLAADLDYAVRLFETLIRAKLPLRWGVQASVGLARNPEVLALAAKSGCRIVFTGFESVSRDALREANKKNRPSEFKELVARYHEHGILIEGGFVNGFDADGLEVFSETALGADDIDVDLAHFSVLTPYPGTGTFARMYGDGRVVDTNWSRYDYYHAVFEPARMTRDQLEAGNREAFRIFYSGSSRRARFRRRLRQGLHPYPVIGAAIANATYARSYVRNWYDPGVDDYQAPPEELEALLQTSRIEAPLAITSAVQSHAERSGLPIAGTVGPAPGARLAPVLPADEDGSSVTVPVSLGRRPG
ncbi:MAG: cobalamin-dependent protein [Acidimicrobiales bacterium]